MWIIALRVLGVVHLLIAGGNCLLPWIFDYRNRGVSTWNPLLRQVFFVHTFYIILVLTLIGLLCLVFPSDLVGTIMGRSICGGLTVFWGIRVGLHFAYYDRAEIQRLGLVSGLFLSAAMTFTGIFAAIAAGAAQ